MQSFDDILKTAVDWAAAGHAVALGTVVETWGSSPRPVGAQLAIRSDGAFVGSVSGGCVEAAVIIEGQDALTDGKVRIFENDVNNEDAFAVDLTSGGAIKILVEPIETGQGPTLLEIQSLVDVRKNRTTVAYAVNTKTWERLVTIGKTTLTDFDVQKRLDTHTSGFENAWFVHINAPNWFLPRPCQICRNPALGSPDLQVGWI